MTLTKEASMERPKYLDFPFFSRSGLFFQDRLTPTPKREILIESTDSIDFFYLGGYKKGDAFIFKPKNPDELTVIFEHRSYHSPIPDNPHFEPNLEELPKIKTNLAIREETIIDREEYLRRLKSAMAKPHRDTQEFLKKYWDMISRIVDPSLNQVINPQCYLEVGFDYENGGPKAKLPVDAFAISHSGLGFLFEVASRRLEDYILRRTEKYEIAERNAKVAKKQYPGQLEITEACIFYEVLENNTIYLSLRYPQEVKTTDTLVI